MIEIEMNELRDLRARFGNDKNAINRHSVRYYSPPGIGHFMIDRNLSCHPPCFTLYELWHDPGEPRDIYAAPYFPPTIKIEGQELWGDGLSWPKAERLAKETIERLVEEYESN